MNPFSTIARLSAWLDQSNGTGDHETAMRLMKLSEETGEVMQAYIGYVGQNPRKGVTHTRQDVADELIDVVVTALVALHRFSDDPEMAFAEKLDRIADRVLAADAGKPAPAQPDNELGKLRAELDRVNDVLRKAGIEYPLGARGVRDLAAFAELAKEDQ